MKSSLCSALLLVLLVHAGFAGSFQLPTANTALFQRNAQERFFVGTFNTNWESGTFGCVRSSGWQIHEGLDIRCLQRDKKGEPTDPVLATAEGTVAYLNPHPALSNYGKYIVLRHQIDGLEIYSLYAHLSVIRPDLKVGQKVQAGENIAVMGRTTNTKETISPERAHVHFELNFFVNDHFDTWYHKEFPDERNDHGVWNGQNLVGIDPRLVLLEEHRLGANFSLRDYVRKDTELCRVFVRKTDFPWLRRYPALIERNPVAEREGVAGYEISLDFNGLAFRLIPRAASEVKSPAKYQLLAVNEAEEQKNPARRLVTHKSGRWELAPDGIKTLDLLTY